MGKIINNLIDIVEIGMSIVWSDVKMISRDIIKVIKVESDESDESDESRENDKLSNGTQFDGNDTKLNPMQDPNGLSRLTTGSYERTALRDENGFPMELHSKDLKSKFGK